MKTAKVQQFSLPKALLYHGKILLVSALLALAFNWGLNSHFFINDFLAITALIFFQMELYISLGSWFFKSKNDQSASNRTKVLLVKLALFFGLVMLIATIINLAFLFFMAYPIENGWADFFHKVITHDYRSFLISSAVGILFGSAVFLYVQWQDAIKREQKLREEKLTFQYETIKNQVNPHFLFNSLNTLSSLIKVDAELSEKFIQKFSSIYRYILENKDASLINLQSEIDFVESYFYLQQIRGPDKVSLEVEFVDPENYEILPISLQILVENSIKHNMASRAQPLQIRIF